MTKARQQERDEAIKELREMLKPGETVYTVLRSVSRSGMTRGIDVYVMRENEPRWITGRVGQAIGQPQSRKDWQNQNGLRIGGCGMDMGFHVVHSLAQVLWRDGFDCIGEGCPSNDHTNREKAPAGTCLDHVERKQGVCQNKECKPWRHQYGGYALQHKWI